MPVEVDYVGKRRLVAHEPSSTKGGGSLPAERSALPGPATRKGLPRPTAEQLYFQLKEFDEFRQPSFNVLYVQTPQPEWGRNALMEAFSNVVGETAEMLAPLNRLLIPKNSLRDKLPYFREDFSPLPNNVRPRVQKVLRSNVEFAEQQARQAQEAEEWMRCQREGREPPSALQVPVGKPHDIHIPHPHFITGEMPIWLVPAMNVAAYIHLCGFWGVGRDLFK